MRITVQLAKTKDEYEQAFRLLQGARYERGLEPERDGFWLLKQHALPSTNTIIAREGNRVVGALSLFGESAFILPLEEKVNLVAFRASLSGRVAELSVPAANGYHHRQDICLALLHFALCFGSSYCLYDAYVTGYADTGLPGLQLRPLPGKKTAYFRHASEGPDLRLGFTPGFTAEFLFPEKKSFLVTHQSIDCGTLDYLFNKKTGLFDRLTDLDIRVLKNYYDHADFASLLPDRKLNLPFKETPKFRRFPMNCEGFLNCQDGKKVHLQVIDVSREGIKIRADGELSAGAYALTLAIGVVKRAEVIASTVWIDDFSQMSGLCVKSGDQNWQQLVEYLESESLKIAA